MNASLFKALMAISKPVASLVRRLWKERQAARNPDTMPDSFADRMLEQALRRLGAICEDSPIWQAAMSKLGGAIVRPDQFNNPHVRRWLSNSSEDLKLLAKQAFTGERSPPEIRERIVDEYSRVSGEGRASADATADVVVAVLRTTLLHASNDARHCCDDTGGVQVASSAPK